MGNACTIKPHIKVNGEAKTLPSKLFEAINIITGNYDTAKQIYGSAIANLDFELNDLGEPSFKSVKEAFKLNAKDQEALKILNSKYARTNLDFDIAAQLIADFNENNELNEDYVASISLQDNGKYNISIVKKDDTSLKELEDTIADYNIVNTLNKLLQEKLGIGTIFSNESSFEGKYSTKEAKQAVDGLYYLIEVSKGHKVSPLYAEEVGHAVVASYGEHPLITRLINLVKDPEVQKSILGDEYETKDLGDNPAREVAGDLVGKALLDALTPALKKSPFMSLVNRIVSFVKKAFSKLTGNDVYFIKDRAEELASAAALGFISPDFVGDLSNNLNTKETLYSRKKKSNSSSIVENAILTAVTNLRQTVEDLRSTKVMSLTKKNFPLDKDIIQCHADLLNMMMEHEDIDINNPAVKRIIGTVLVGSNQLVTALAEIVSRDSFRNMHVLTDENLKEIFNALRSAILIVEGLNPVYDALSNVNLSDDVLFSSVEDVTEIRAQDELKQSLLELSQHTKDLAVTLFTLFATRLYGRSFIVRGERTVWNLAAAQDKTMLNYYHTKYDEAGRRDPFSGMFVTKSKEQVINFKQEFLKLLKASSFGILSGLDSHIVSFIYSMQNQPNLMTLLCKMAIDNQRRAGLKLFAKDRNFMIDFLTKVSAVTGSSNTRWMFKMRKGVPTGWFKSKYDWGKYEANLEEFKSQLYISFINALDEEHMDSSSDIPEVGYARALRNKDAEVFDRMYLLYAERLILRWYKENSVKDPKTGEWVPNSEYRDDSWDNLTEDLKALIEEYAEYQYLKEVDNLGEEGAKRYRVPLIYGTFSNRVRNNSSTNSPYDIISALKVMWSSIVHSFSFNDEDVMKGDYYVHRERKNGGVGMSIYDLYDKEDVRPKWVTSTNRESSIQRLADIPIKGTRMRYNRDELSTDLAYSAAEYFYFLDQRGALSRVVNLLETAAYIMKTHLDASSKLNSLDFMILRNGLNSHLYRTKGLGLYSGKATAANWWASKISGLLRKSKYVGSMLALAYNPNPASVNLLTGINELGKEAFAGEFFTTKEATLATWYYMNARYYNLKEVLVNKNLWSDPKKFSEFELGEGYNVNQRERNNLSHYLYVSAFLSAMDVQDATENKIHSLRHNIAQRIMLGSPFVFYSSTDHYMLSAPCLAMALHTKLWDTSWRKSDNKGQATGIGQRVVDLFLAHTFDFEYTIDPENGERKVKRNEEGRPIIKEYGVQQHRYLKLPDGLSSSQLEEEAERILDEISEYNDLLEKLKGWSSSDLQKLEEFINRMQEEAILERDEDEDYDDSNLSEEDKEAAKWYAIIDRARTVAGRLSEKLDYDVIVAAILQAIDSYYWSDTDEYKFMNKSREVANRLHGIYNSIDAGLWQSSDLGGAQMSMKGYFSGMLLKRLSSNFYSLVFDKDIEGSWNTWWKLVFDGRHINYDKGKGWLANMLDNIWEYNARWWSDSARRKAGYTALQSANINREIATTLCCLGMFTVFLIAKGILAATIPIPSGDPDKEEIEQYKSWLFNQPKYNWFVAEVSYLTYKAFIELALWAMPYLIIPELIVNNVDLPVVGDFFLNNDLAVMTENLIKGNNLLLPAPPNKRGTKYKPTKMSIASVSLQDLSNLTLLLPPSFSIIASSINSYTKGIEAAVAYSNLLELLIEPDKITVTDIKESEDPMVTEMLEAKLEEGKSLKEALEEVAKDMNSAARTEWRNNLKVVGLKVKDVEDQYENLPSTWWEKMGGLLQIPNVRKALRSIPWALRVPYSLESPKENREGIEFYAKGAGKNK